jgi:hypothetical protein
VAGDARSVAIGGLAEGDVGIAALSSILSLSSSAERRLPFSIQDPDLSFDGSVLAFTTSESLVALDTNDEADVYRLDLGGAVPELVSANGSGGAGNEASGSPTMSADGERIAFESLASDLGGGDGDAFSDLFLWSGTDGRVSAVLDPGLAGKDEGSGQW